MPKLYGYQPAIREVVPDLPPGEVEAVMRLKVPTLDHLTRSAFNRLAKESASIIRANEEMAAYAKEYAL